MKPKAPLAVESADLAEHPAALAWAGLGGDPPQTVELWRVTGRSKPALYRLTFASPAEPAVFAKRSQPSGLALERMVYEEILPALPVTTPRYRGTRMQPDGSTWLFVEDVGEERLSPSDPAHRAVAARWLGLLHRSGADAPAAARLPDAGPRRYREHLRAGREAVRRGCAGPGLGLAERDVLNGVLGQHDALESRWDRIESACERLPVTLVHGDFQPKNVRLRLTDAGPALYPLDWEMAGWGVPAADLGNAYGRGLNVEIEPRTYGEIARERWADLDEAAIRRLSVLGRIFQALAGIAWAGAEEPISLPKPISSMRLYTIRISEALAEGAEWLG